YGPNDNYDLEKSHVIPALIRKFHEAKVNNAPTVEVWGSGKPMREFMHVDDLADACLFLMGNYSEERFINIGSGKEISIKELAVLIKTIEGYQGDLKFNTSKPDGTPRKLMDTSRINNLEWNPKINLEEGLERIIKTQQ
ncbi:MAG: NAD-dependent epimerase/dehydratase family protein, partial [Cyclobacteriaceae bacterium]|nr:NAD-dependent epimerase/dehydratase family protein [Cyclobacteriaceae bacterium]